MITIRWVTEDTKKHNNRTRRYALHLGRPFTENEIAPGHMCDKLHGQVRSELDPDTVTLCHSPPGHLEENTTSSGEHRAMEHQRATPGFIP